MRAVVLEGPGGPEVLRIREVGVPGVEAGWVRIRVEAFGLNRSEYHLRAGLATNARFPIVPGIEAVGTVDLAPGGEFAVGQQVVAMMGGMGREFDGGYAEYTVVPVSSVLPVQTDLDWAMLGALPEMLQTAHGSLHTGLGIRPGQTLLVRGGTSSVGVAAAVLAKEFGLTVFSTTRNPGRVEMLRGLGVDHPLVDDGNVAEKVREIVPEGVDAALELVGTNVLPDTLRSTKVHGTVCFTGMLSDQWTIPDFYPIGYLPNGVRLTGYGGESSDLPAADFQRYVDLVAEGKLPIRLDRVFAFEEIVEAHRVMEAGSAVGKLVVRVR
ncbi:zinc-binding alcohol dehydrogenase family protein [Kribbella sp. VKM Ac-2568]|uniref:zinc-binding alcohol dehydrogenase family protein n=1 Tax=Kribbella sp. VKM Ac-2568 TaxID=2512219 RepID=UPI0010D8B771|nr:zinc-binding alcohol dehydrogenase family protein [Kribbella sp. VKM Ac-2568]TCM45541.1 NADPH:quinone reductase-like Zn-dependent oxidoreductase [Kribbella sp. VKM Ac-2568]